MKNKFVYSLMLSAVAVFTNAAEPMKVKLGGRMDTMYGSVKQSSNYRNTNSSNPGTGNALVNSGIVNDTRIDINIDGAQGKHFKYGGLISLHADTSVATNGETSINDKTSFYVQHDQIGKLEAGNTPGGHALFEMDTVNFNKGSWGVDGFWSKWVAGNTMNVSKLNNKNLTVYGMSLNSASQINPLATTIPGTKAFEFIMSPNLLSNVSGQYYSDAPKINLFTKPIKELTLAATFIPDMDSHGTISGLATSRDGGPSDTERANNSGTFKNIIGLGVMIEHKIKDFDIKANLSGETGKAKLAGYRDLKAYEAGLKMTYSTVSIGGSYGNWGKSMTSKTPSANAKQGAEYWTAGLGQQIDKVGYSVTYMQSKKAGGIEVLYSNPKLKPLFTQADFSDTSYNKFENIVLDIDYQVAPGLLAYSGVSKFRFKEATGSVDKGYVFMAGTRLVF